MDIIHQQKAQLRASRRTTRERGHAGRRPSDRRVSGRSSSMNGRRQTHDWSPVHYTTGSTWSFSTRRRSPGYYSGHRVSAAREQNTQSSYPAVILVQRLRLLTLRHRLLGLGLRRRDGGWRSATCSRPRSARTSRSPCPSSCRRRRAAARRAGGLAGMPFAAGVSGTSLAPPSNDTSRREA
jgi:hypothetical protein